MAPSMQIETNQAQGGLRQIARHGVIWSVIQNWGGKILTFLLSVLLARLLSPSEFGIASAASLVLILIPMIAEFGFKDAILQRKNLKAEDVNLPFYSSIFVSALMALAVVLMSDRISVWLETPALSLYISVIAGTILINVPSLFQEAVYKRNLKFRILALRTFVASIVGGVAAIVCAWFGFGVWSFVVQAYVVGIVSMIWLWWTPLWRPSLKFDPLSFLQLLRFGLPVVGQRLVDFAGTRFIDLLIIQQLGLALYGVYVVGYRLYQTMMMMLQGAFYEVSLTVLSTIASDQKRIAEVYLKTIGLSASYITPVFVLLAVLSPEICLVLYGDQWRGVDIVSILLLLMGAVQCVQYMNGSFLSARGRPEITLIAGIVKTVAPLAGLLLIPAQTLEGLVVIFVVGQLVAAPVSFFFVARELNLKSIQVIKVLYPAAINGLLSFLAVWQTRPMVQELHLNAFWQGMALGVVYTVCWVILTAIFDRPRLTALLKAILSKVRRSSSSAKVEQEKTE